LLHLAFFQAGQHVRLLPTGRDIYNVIERYFDLDPAWCS